jgi:DNA-binding protein HU-beta
MTKAELIAMVASQFKGNISQRAMGEIVDVLFSQLHRSIKKDKRFGFPGFGSFCVRRRAARQGRNPQTNQIIQIPARNTVVFKPAKSFKSSL